jgi:hypothetical protein
MHTLRARRALPARCCPEAVDGTVSHRFVGRLGRHRSGRWRDRPAARGHWRSLSRMGAVTAVLFIAAPGQAAAETTRTQIHIPLRVLTNLCNNAEPVQLSGDEYITTTTTPTSNGGFTVTASIVAPNLTGTGLVSMVAYRGVDGQQTFSYFAPPPFPSTYDVTLYTVLKPLSSTIKSMYLVTRIRQTIAFDGMPITTFQDVSLTCTQPRCSAQRRS